jgi:hypothetical protein
VWQLAVHPIIKYATLSQPPPPPPKKRQLTNLICNNIFKTVSINRHYFSALLNLGLNSFPLGFSLVRRINVCAVFHGDARRSILIENIDFHVRDTYLQARSCFVIDRDKCSPIRLSVTWYRLWYSSPPLVTLCDSWSNTPYTHERHVFCEWPHRVFVMKFIIVWTGCWFFFDRCITKHLCQFSWEI